MADSDDVAMNPSDLADHPLFVKESKRRPRMAEVRREQIELLQQEATDLEQHLELLWFRATGVSNQQSLLYQQVLENPLLREFLRNQKYAVAGLKSAISMDTTEHLASPLSSTIYLGPVPAARREFLRAIKPQKIYCPRQFLKKRTQSLDMTKRFADTTQFETTDGDVCVVKLDVVPLYYAANVKQVYDALLFHVLNVEICTAEINGDVVVREETDTDDESVSQNRFVFRKPEFGADAETNNATFCEYTPRKENTSLSPPSYFPDIEAEQSDNGVVTIDFVDQDDLCPYRPSEHIRDDATAAAMAKSYRLHHHARRRKQGAC